jgi:hypothetical protein
MFETLVKVMEGGSSGPQPFTKSVANFGDKILTHSDLWDIDITPAEFFRQAFDFLWSFLVVGASSSVGKVPGLHNKKILREGLRFFRFWPIYSPPF